jgi:hypothetical protein
MSKDWYNVFNRAFNGKVKELKYIFPILGSLMGFLHGYKEIRRRKNYKFSNDTYLENLANDFFKKLYLNRNMSFNNSRNYIVDYSVYEHYNKTLALSIFRLSSGLELPLLLSDKDQELRRLKEKLLYVDELTKKIREKKQLERDIEILLAKTSKSYD